MAERSNALVLKTGSPQGLVGSNPTPSATPLMPDPQPTANNLSISRKVVLGVAFTLVMLALIALISFVSTRRLLGTVAEANEVREMLERSERLHRYFLEMESGVRGYMLSGDDALLIPYGHGQSFIIEEIRALRKATEEILEQQFRLDRIQSLASRAFAAHGRAIERRREGGVGAAALIFTDATIRGEMEEIFGGVRDELNDFDQFERTHLRELGEALDTIGRVNTSLVVGGTSLTYIALLVACLFILRDIAVRRQAEQTLEVERNLLRSIMDTIPDLIFVMDPHGRYTRDNAAHRRQLGVRSESDVIGLKNSDLFPAELAARFTADDAAVISGGKTMLNVEEPARTRDGTEIWLETTKVPLRDAEGKIIGLVGVSADITRRHADEQRLRHFASALQKSNEELQNFASVASHDLQEPLRKIQAFGDRLRSRNAGELSEAGRDYLNRMLDAANRMQTLIQDLLKLSRVTTRAQPFERCSLDDVVRGVLSDLEVKIAASRARITASGLPTIEADATQMRQLFQNLTTNALKFQHPGTSPEITITARTSDNLNGELQQIPPGTKICEIRVADNGLGFDQQFAEQIFSPFKRLHARTEYEGSGIGLTVCRKITDRHHGKITAEGSEGKGAAFIVTLPVKQLPSYERRD